MSACSEMQKLLPVYPGSVPPDEFRRISEHLKSCPECKKLQEQLQALDVATSEIGIPDPGDKLRRYTEALADLSFVRHSACRPPLPRCFWSFSSAGE